MIFREVEEIEDDFCGNDVRRFNDIEILQDRKVNDAVGDRFDGAAFEASEIGHRYIFEQSYTLVVSAIPENVQQLFLLFKWNGVVVAMLWQR
jgi:hypothetical protein